MQHHVEPTVRNSDQDHIILQCGTNDMNSEKRFSQIAKEIIELALSVNPYKFLYTKIINNQVTSQSKFFVKHSNYSCIDHPGFQNSISKVL